VPLTFLNPVLLFGTLAAGVPLILHLLQNRRPRRVPFSDLRFLRDVQVRHSRSLGVQRWLLLLLRMLAIILLVFGVARPRLGGLVPAAGERTSLMVILDASASMQTLDVDGTSRFEMALTRALGLAEGVGSSSDVQWVLGAARARPVFGDWLPVESLRSQPPQGLTAGDGAFDLAVGLETAADLLPGAGGTPIVVVITDGQVPASTAEDLAGAGARLAALGVTGLEFIKVGDPVDNSAVLDVRLPSRSVRPGDVFDVEVDVRALRLDQRFRLAFGDRLQAEAFCENEAMDVGTVRFSLTAPGPGLHFGTVQTDHDAFEADDQRPFVLDVRPRLEILLIHGEGPASAGRSGWRYLERALAPDLDQDGPIVVTSVATDGWQGGDLDRFDVVVLADPDPVGRRRLDALRAWLESGGRLWIMLGDPAGGDHLREHLLPTLAGIADARYRVLSDSGVERLRPTARSHPILEGLPDEALATLAEVSWQRVWSIDPGSWTVVAELEGGDPLFLAGERGRGRLFLQTAALGTESTDFSRNAMALPLAQRVVSWLAAGQGGPPELEAGLPLAWKISGWTPDQASPTAETILWSRPSGSKKAPRSDVATLDWSSSRPLVHGPDDPRAGHWLLTVGGDTISAATTVVPRSESLGSVDESLFSDAVSRTGLNPGRSLDAGSSSAIGAALSGRDLAPWFFLAALIVLLLETRLSRGKS